MADPNTTDINEWEEKKWLISRIDLYHETIIEEFQNQMSKYENIAEGTLSKLRSYRSYSLSVLGIFLTVFLGYDSAYRIDQTFFFTILTVLGSIGLLVITFFNWLIRRGENIFAQLIEIFTEGIGNLGYSHGYIITGVAELSKITLKFTQNYMTFSILLTFAISIRTSKTLRKFAKKYFTYSPLKSILIDDAKTYEEQNEYIPQYYEKLDRSQKMPVGLLKMMDKDLADYKPREIE